MQRGLGRYAVLLALVLLAGASFAGEKGGPIWLRATDVEGTILQGRALLKKDALEVDTASGTKKLPWRRVAEIEEIDADAPPPEIERTRDRATFDERAAKLERKTDELASLARQWSSLGEWARKHGLADEARRAFEKAVAISADDPDGERALGRAKDDDGSWKDARSVFAKKKAASSSEPAACYELARWAVKNALDDAALDAIEPLAKKNPFDKQLLAFIRPITDRHRQLESIRFPLRGRFRASQDPGHHHELKTYAVYAIDFYGDVDGKAWKGDGKELADHYIWGKEVHAVADGIVTGATNDFPDNPVGKVPPGDLQLANNGVAIVHSGGEMSWYIHLQKGSVKVKVGDSVKQGDVIALVGNSGASYQPHLHFTLVDAQRLSIPWRCEGFSLLSDDGAKVRVKRGRIVEGQLIEAE